MGCIGTDLPDAYHFAIRGDVYKRQMYKGLMFHVAMKILKNEFDAEDAVHQALSLIHI